MIRKIFLFSLIYIFHCSYAYAYLDPGTGSVILTAIVTALAAGLATINSFKIKLKKITNKIFFKKDTLTKDNKKKWYYKLSQYIKNFSANAIEECQENQTSDI